MARDARNAVDRGYDTLKIKVGADPSLDLARLMAVRKEVGDNIRIRIDANQAWSPKQARQAAQPDAGQGPGHRVRGAACQGPRL